MGLLDMTAPGMMNQTWQGSKAPAAVQCMTAQESNPARLQGTSRIPMQSHQNQRQSKKIAMIPTARCPNDNYSGPQTFARCPNDNYSGPQTFARCPNDNYSGQKTFVRCPNGNYRFNLQWFIVQKYRQKVSKH